MQANCLLRKKDEKKGFHSHKMKTVRLFPAKKLSFPPLETCTEEMEHPTETSPTSKTNKHRHYERKKAYSEESYGSLDSLFTDDPIIIRRYVVVEFKGGVGRIFGAHPKLQVCHKSIFTSEVV